MAFLRSFTACDVRVEPDFEQQTFRGYLKGDLRIVPLRMMVLFTLFALSPTTLRAIKALVVARRK